MTNEAELIEIQNGYSPGYEDTDDYWGDFTWAGTGLITHEATGTLREMVLARVGKSEGRVLVEENHVDIGYCPSCTSETVHIRVLVDGQEVWSLGYVYDSPFATLQRWLTEQS